jgi:hypothetical protein
VKIRLVTKCPQQAATQMVTKDKLNIFYFTISLTEKDSGDIDTTKEDKS